MAAFLIESDFIIIMTSFFNVRLYCYHFEKLHSYPSTFIIHVTRHACTTTEFLLINSSTRLIIIKNKIKNKCVISYKCVENKLDYWITRCCVKLLKP